jgi:hypothetical protein
MSTCDVHPTNRFNQRRYGALASVFFLLMMACELLLPSAPHGIPSLVVAGGIGAFFCAELATFALLALSRFDEFQRVLLTRSFIWATFATMALCSIWGFVELHGRAEVPHLQLMMLPVILALFTAAAKLILFRQHKSPAE